MDYLCGLTDDPAPKPPTLFSVDLCPPVWQPLDAAHWPEEGELVVLSYETGLDAARRVQARRGGRMKNAYAKEQAELRRRWIHRAEVSRRKRGVPGVRMLHPQKESATHRKKRA